MVDAGGAFASTGGGSSSSSSSGGTSGPAAAYGTFRSLVERADRKFARVRDLPAYGREGHPHCQRKVFEAYTRLWRFQQEHRRELVEAGMRRWEIGEVASRIGQLYYGQYLRTSDVRFLLESYVFYEAILGRGYFERGKEAACGRSPAGKQQQQLSDLGVRCKELRFYARFAVVALLMNRRQMVVVLVDKFRALVDDSRVRFPWDPSPKFSRGVPALKMVPGVPVKVKVQGEHVSVQSTKHGKIRQHKVYRPSTKDKYKEQARGRTPKLHAAVFYWAKLQSTKHGKIRQHKVYRPSTKDKYKE
ncbi:hypothetical protein Taro_002829 [Colocasia esculenta]|uniref:Uncharacterized protein n=1 Tax=Colocasia esculenta TaxID=4460 RepID=A0A843TKA7_COLES|nr:hypothetical protein [Colocasia esculenta]